MKLPDKSMNKAVSVVHTSATKLFTPTLNYKAASFCSICIDFSSQALDQLLNAILQVGVLGTCGEICSVVQQKTGSQILGVACNLLCDFAGVEEFVKIIDKADLDPIYYCELLKACPIKDNGDASITSLQVAPPTGPQGTFIVDMRYTSINGTGTGEIGIEIDTVDNLPLGDSFLNLPQNPGKYDFQVKINAQPDPDCDPTQGPCEQWLPGQYTVNMCKYLFFDTLSILNVLLFP